MIVNWKKENAGVLVLPCMKGTVLIKQIFILPGHNDVPDEDWEMVRGQKNVQRKLDNKTLEILAKEVPVKFAKKSSTSSDKGGTVDLLTEKAFPYNEVVAILKDKEWYSKICKVKKKDDGKPNLSKTWLIKYLTKEKEDWDEILEELSPSKVGTETEESTTTELTAIKLQDLPQNKATDVIADTFNMETLELWKKEVSQPDLRVLILNQIEEVNKPPKGGQR